MGVNWILHEVLHRLAIIEQTKCMWAKKLMKLNIIFALVFYKIFVMVQRNFTFDVKHNDTCRQVSLFRHSMVSIVHAKIRCPSTLV